MIVDLSSGAMRRTFVAGGASVWSFSFSAFGEVPTAVYEHLFRPTLDVLFRPTRASEGLGPHEKIWPYEKD